MTMVAKLLLIFGCVFLLGVSFLYFTEAGVMKVLLFAVIFFVVLYFTFGIFTHRQMFFDFNTMRKHRIAKRVVSLYPTFEGKVLNNFFRRRLSWGSSGQPNCSSLDWAHEHFTVRKAYGVKYVELDASLGERFHEHTKLRFVGVGFSRWTQWFEVAATCSFEEYELETIVPFRSTFWSHFEHSALMSGLNEKLFLLPPHCGSSSLDQNILDALNRMPDNLNYVDFHDMYFHPEVFAERFDCVGVPADFVKAMFGLPPKMLV